MTEEFQYTIGGKKYRQRRLVFGQLRQLEAVVSDIAINKNMDIAALVRQLISGGALGTAIAIVLIPDGIKLKDKKVYELAAEIDFDLEIDTAVQVVEDFFICNPIHSLIEKIGKAGDRIQAKMTAIPTGSPESSASLPAETSPSGTPLCGSAAPETAPTT